MRGPGPGPANRMAPRADRQTGTAHRLEVALSHCQPKHWDDARWQQRIVEERQRIEQEGGALDMPARTRRCVVQWPVE